MSTECDYAEIWWDADKVLFKGNDKKRVKTTIGFGGRQRLFGKKVFRKDKNEK